ncbi:ABC transporter ATP-binding protein [Lentilactobacillus diolivorans]|uniref:ABC superfamily ATP binding cassette transporter, ABC protein n=2 Tax=Lentilactobacillus diolivorans TaxID=179838 RepID=A0A0R1SAL9_9LACO|nr:ABC transporter ATP-binding protein [Lentilactobacillus diolivorans]KRL66096.1 ABC superfamily ATP binding cassette transporter, ABC protein [Lentilactobacillus diolivorans DSM 14421]GEP24788.1 ABC transporter ATP-binding protein [Lentilactobacillus diolivorans]
MNAVTINHLKKSFGSKSILNDVSFSVPQGSIFGFVGENGAGKTTTMKIILGLLESDQGEVIVNGQQVRYGRSLTNRFIGYLPDVPAFYPYMTARQYLQLTAAISGMAHTQIDRRISSVLNTVQLKDDLTKIRGYSRGMKQRLGMAVAMLNQPQILICDEPTSALDPLGRKAFLDILASLRGQTTVIFSSHILSDIERVCDRVAILHNGHIQVSGKISTLTQTHSNKTFQIDFVNSTDVNKFLVQTGLSKTTYKQDQLTLTIYEQPGQPLGELLLADLSKSRIVPKQFQQFEPSLEDVFLEAIK